MKFPSVVICVYISLFFPLSSAGQEEKLKNLSSLKNAFSTQISYSELFDVSKQYFPNQGKIQSFNFLKEYEVRFYDVSKYYFNTSSIIPYNITYEKPALYYHLVQDYAVIKKRKK